MKATHKIEVRVTEAEKIKFQGLATEKQTTISKLVKSIIYEQPTTNQTTTAGQAGTNTTKFARSKKFLRKSKKR